MCYMLEILSYSKILVYIIKIHRVLQFNESPWLAKYVDFNINKRSTAKNAFEKDFLN